MTESLVNKDGTVCDLLAYVLMMITNTRDNERRYRNLHSSVRFELTTCL